MNRRRFLAGLGLGGAAVAVSLMSPRTRVALAQRPTWRPPPPADAADLARLRAMKPPLGRPRPFTQPPLPPDLPMPVVTKEIAGPSGQVQAVSMVTLPQNLLKNAGALLEDFEDVSSWAASNGTIASNTAQKLTGASSLKVTGNAGASTIVETTKTLNLATTRWLQWSFYLHNADAADLAGFQLWLTADPCWNEWHDVNLPNDYLYYYVRTGAWNTVRLLVSDLYSQNSDLWRAPRHNLAFGVDSASGKQAIVSLDKFQGGVQPVPAVMLTIDDGYASLYTEAFAYARQHGVRGTGYIWTGMTGQSGFATVAQLQEMAANGWAIGNHTRNHTQLATVDQATAQTALRQARQDLQGWGLGAAAYHVAYPSSSYNATTVLAAMAAEGMLSGRTCDWAPCYMPDDPLRIPASSLEVAVSLDTAKGYIDQAIARNELLVLFTHDIEATPSETYNWSIDAWRGLIDYIVAKKLPTINILDYYNLMSGSVQVPIPY